MPDDFNIPRVNVLGVGISVLNLPLATRLVLEAVKQSHRGYICVTGVHGVTVAQEDESFRRVLNRAFLCTPDGMPMVWAGKLNGHKHMSRVYGPDLMLEIFKISAASGIRHFFYGGNQGVAEALRIRQMERFPGLTVTGTYEPPFRPLDSAEEKALKSQVKEGHPHIIWVGLSTPKQEQFMARYLEVLDTTLMIGVGAAFDFHAGRVKQAPRWMQRTGLEWFYRLCQEPGRLWKRYLKNNPLFAARAFCQATGLKKYSLD